MRLCNLQMRMRDPIGIHFVAILFAFGRRSVVSLHNGGVLPSVATCCTVFMVMLAALIYVMCRICSTYSYHLAAKNMETAAQLIEKLGDEKQQAEYLIVCFECHTCVLCFACFPTDIACMPRLRLFPLVHLHVISTCSTCSTYLLHSLDHWLHCLLSMLLSSYGVRCHSNSSLLSRLASFASIIARMHNLLLLSCFSLCYSLSSNAGVVMCVWLHFPGHFHVA